ncbi:hypothetical protein GOBAR_DD20828 [Gossypium barbadense]|nr:hypothetical protein GOBAR_DD20828 [Gossypium barbadense]
MVSSAFVAAKALARHGPLHCVNDMLTSVSSQVLTSNIVRHPFSARKPQNKSSVDSHRCTYCGGSRHTIDTCYKKHGYPPGYKSKRPTSRVNLAVDEKVTPASESSSSVSTDSNVALTSMQIQQLLALLPSSSQSSHITSQVLVETPESTEALPSMKMMGTAKVFNGLYVLELSVLPTPSPSTKLDGYSVSLFSFFLGLIYCSATDFQQLTWAATLV